MYRLFLNRRLFSGDWLSMYVNETAIVDGTGSISVTKFARLMYWTVCLCDWLTLCATAILLSRSLWFVPDSVARIWFQGTQPISGWGIEAAAYIVPLPRVKKRGLPKTTTCISVTFLNFGSYSNDPENLSCFITMLLKSIFTIVAMGCTALTLAHPALNQETTLEDLAGRDTCTGARCGGFAGIPCRSPCTTCITPGGCADCFGSCV